MYLEVTRDPTPFILLAGIVAGLLAFLAGRVAGTGLRRVLFAKCVIVPPALVVVPTLLGTPDPSDDLDPLAWAVLGVFFFGPAILAAEGAVLFGYLRGRRQRMARERARDGLL